VAAADRAAAGRVRAIDVVDAGGHVFCTVGGLGIISRAAFLATRCARAAGRRAPPPAPPAPRSTD
jgi:diacylglycerol kinase family enzyme